MYLIDVSQKFYAGRALLVTLTGVVLVTGSASNALAGTLQGRLVVPAIASAPQQASVSAYPGIEVPMSATEDARAATPVDAVIWIEKIAAAAHGGAFTLSPAPELRQVRYSFKPRVLGVPVGTTVEFPNEDAIFHNVFSYSKTKRFDLGYYGKGKSKRVTFDKPGLVKVFCDIHSTMSAFIMVADSPFVVSPGTDGRFVFEEVPEGTWRIRAWHPELGETSSEVVVTGPTVSVEIHY